MEQQTQKIALGGGLGSGEYGHITGGTNIHRQLLSLAETCIEQVFTLSFSSTPLLFLPYPTTFGMMVEYRYASRPVNIIPGI